MPTCRVIRNGNYTTVSNCHLRDKGLSLKAKGLLTLMLSLPDDWDYTVRGLATLSADGRDSITATLNELEEHGYVRRYQCRDEKGIFSKNEYWIYETPQAAERAVHRRKSGKNPATPLTENPSTDRTENPAFYDEFDEKALSYLDSPYPATDTEVRPLTENPTTDGTEESCETEKTDVAEDTESESANSPLTAFPSTAYPSTGNPLPEKPPQLITYIPNTEIQKIRYDEMRTRVREQIEARILEADYLPEKIGEIVSLIAEVYSCEGDTVVIAGSKYPTEVVVSRMEQLTCEHIRYVLDSICEKRPKIKNIKQYLLTSLFNATATMDNYYDARVRNECKGYV